MTNFLKDTLLLQDGPTRPKEEVAEILQEEVQGMSVNETEPGFEVVTTVSQVYRIMSNIGRSLVFN